MTQPGASRRSAGGLLLTHRAERELAGALKLLGPTGGRPSATLLGVWNELGVVCKYLGKFEDARRWYRSALRHCDSCLTGTCRYDFLANLYHNLGGLEHSLRRVRTAEPYARKSVAFRRKVRPRNAVAITADRVALAAILDGREKFAESVAIYQSALKTYRRVFGASHREIALVLNNLAAVYQKTDRVRRAEKSYRAALAMKMKTLGKNHPDVAVTMNNLGMLLARENQSAEAREYFEKAYRVSSRALGMRHTNSRAILENLRRAKTSTIKRA